MVKEFVLEALDLILLIDDDEDDNFFHSRIIRKGQFANQIDAVSDGFEAVAYLLRETPFDQFMEDYPMPDLIFLDINMPRMNGWEFSEQFREMSAEIQKSPIVMMLTTSLNPDEEEKAKKYGVIKGLLSKPLTQEKTHEIVQLYFPGRL